MVALLCARSAAEVVRSAVAAGEFYPEKSKELRDTVRRYIKEGEFPIPNGRILACLVPHSAYTYCGSVLGSAVGGLQPRQYRRVVMLGPSHTTRFEACSVPQADSFFTPLGFVLLDHDYIEAIARSPFVSERALHYNRPQWTPLHEVEFSLEVPLPFFQDRLDTFWFVPILVGDLSEPQGALRAGKIQAIAETLQRCADERTLFVASSDLTHCGNDFHFTPQGENMLTAAEALDKALIERILAKDAEGFHALCAGTGANPCGAEAIEILLHLLPKSAVGVLTRYDNSARVTGRNDKRVGYAGIVFVDPTKPPLSGEVPETPSPKSTPETPPGP